MITVGVVDDHTLFRKSMCALIDTFEGVRVALEAENGKVLFSKLPATRVEILLVDLNMPVMDGYETCKLLSQEYPEIKIIVISQLASKESILKCIQVGSHGYFSKSADPAYLEKAIRSIHQSGFYFEPGLSPVLNEIILDESRSKKNTDPLCTLTEREMKLVSLTCEGYSSEEIAHRLCINIRTVESHRRKILDKTEARNFTAVILMAIKYKYVAVDGLLTRTA
ncbi:MAG: response regulator transcription factor [Chitinophagaceae bacterium]|nr:MAG: response regulator transcription factor [Chitinophagaceae bacterium]